MCPRAIYHFIPEEETFEERLNSRLAESHEAILASVFLTSGALERFKDALVSALDNGAKIKFLIGRYDFVTEPKAIRALLRLAGKYPKQLDIFFDSDFEFHYKLALFKSHRKPIMIIGSSNLTPKGLDTTGEINLEIVHNNGIYRQAILLLNERFKTASSAGECIDEYQRGYKRAKKFRVQRSHWRRRGAKIWTRRHGRMQVNGLAEKEFAICRIEKPEVDPTLKKNIEKEYSKIQKTRSFPEQWVHCWKPDDRRYRVGKMIFLIDYMRHRFGFAECTAKFRVLDCHDSRELVIFYKFLRGAKAQFNDEGKYEQMLAKFRLGGNRIAVKADLSEKLKIYFRKIQVAAG